MSGDTQLAFASIAEIAKLYRARKLSPVELTRLLLGRIEKYNPGLRAFLTVTAELAFEQAAAAERELGKGRGRVARRDRGLLHGIPISLKDNLYTAGVRTTAGSEILGRFVPTEDAPVVTALKQAGAVLLGKNNMHEFAYGITSNNPHYGAVGNPWDPARISGGSSGGSAAALAAGLCYGSIGTDTGGSIRVPSALCGTVGLKTTLGRISTKNVIPLSPTLDVVGPMGRTASDVATLFQAIRSSNRSRSGAPGANLRAARDRKPRLGIPKEFFEPLLSREVAAAVDSAFRRLGQDGARLKTVSLPELNGCEEAGNLIAWAEAALFHQQSGWFPARAGEYGSDVLSRLEMGGKVSATSYLEALQLREQFIRAFHSLLEKHDLDALLLPTTPITAPLIGEEFITIDAKTYSTRALLLRLNRPANLGGMPALSIPCAVALNHLPVGLQLIGPYNSESTLLAIARKLEPRKPFRIPPLERTLILPPT